MYRIATTTTQNREPQLPRASRNTNPHVSKSSGVNHTTSVSRPQLKNFLGTVHFGNDQFALILGYGDLNQGNVTIKRVYYVEGLNHNLFSVGQFCDADLEVAFRKSTCFVRDLQGNDLLMIHLDSFLRSKDESPEFSKTSHNDSIFNLKLLGPYDRAAQSYLNKDTPLLISKKKALNIRLPLLEHLNRTALSKDGTTLLLRLLEQCSQLLSFHYHFGLKQLKTACLYTQNRSIIISAHGKTVDGENLDKMKEKGDPCVMVGYSTQSKGYRVYNKRTRLIVESIHIKFDEIKEMMSDHNSSDLARQ
ncbi:hypothetical protein Tco_0874235 [Tanacetum coccineum]|uniref:Retroviral polymerase SH3-like domain-containing protein n=1 Tax=Tanacetum coccineum TaxID=301880 RepID=A0ABQ5BMQ8_9ASTR